MMEQVGEKCVKMDGEGKIGWILQHGNMSEQERENFLDFFDEQADETRVGLCVMGGIFGEGIDLRADRLIGAAIVGTGLPIVGKERELFRNYYEEKKKKGFEFAYLYPGMNKVLQAAGRVIRTVEDRGAILLLDERFIRNEYRNLFPKEWNNHHIVNIKQMGELLDQFWKNHT